MKFEVIVGNVGTVYSGGEMKKALEAFGEYRKQSQSDYGRAAGEDVTMLGTVNGKTIVQKEYVGSISRGSMED